jgi:hypothetical protein
MYEYVQDRKDGMQRIDQVATSSAPSVFRPLPDGVDDGLHAHGARSLSSTQSPALSSRSRISPMSAWGR